MQYGSHTGCQCQSAVLQKVLCHDMARITKSPTTFIKNDAIGCYDRLVNNLILLLLARLGFANSVCSCLGALWDSTTHFIKTLCGTCSVTYCSTAEVPLFGPGQGSTTGPPFWLTVFFAIVEVIRSHHWMGYLQISVPVDSGRFYWLHLCCRLLSWCDFTSLQTMSITVHYLLTKIPVRKSIL